MKRRLWMLVLIVVLLGYYAMRPRDIRHAPGVLVADEPQQTAVEPPKAWEKNGYRITTLAAFRMKARVLGSERYRLGRESSLAPVDLAVGWGPMSDQRVLDELSISQGFRWYEWRCANQPPIPERDIETHSANMHMIPADKAVEKSLKSIRSGHVIELSGYLVRVETNDGWKWLSSTSRTDTRGGSCELVWVENLTIVP